jgi:hypothetical protein
MNLEAIFSFCSTLALVSWLVLFVFYDRDWVYRVLFSVPIILLGIIYVFFIAQGMGADSEGGFGSLAEVALLFKKDEALLAGWIHYLAFDLFAGMWEAYDAKRLGISRWLLLPCLILTFMLGPTGLLLYFIIRAVKQRSIYQHPHLP